MGWVGGNGDLGSSRTLRSNAAVGCARPGGGFTRPGHRGTRTRRWRGISGKVVLQTFQIGEIFADGLMDLVGGLGYGLLNVLQSFLRLFQNSGSIIGHGLQAGSHCFCKGKMKDGQIYHC